MSCNNDKTAKVLKTVGPILSKIQTGDEKSVDQPRIVAASFNQLTGVMTLTRDDGTIINVVIGSPMNYTSAYPDGTLVVQDVGGIEAGTNVTDLNGYTLSAIIDRMLFPPVNPTLLLSGTFSGYNEVGSTINPVLTTTYTANSAGALTSLSLEKDTIEIATSSPYTDTGLTATTPQTFTYQSIAVHAADALPIGSITSNELTYDFIYPYFWGVSADNAIDAADIVAGTKVVSTSNTITVDFNSTSTEYLWVAIPSTYPDFNSWYVNALNQGSIGAPTDLFGAPTIVSVTGTGWTGVNYKLYVSEYTTEVTDPMILD